MTSDITITGGDASISTTDQLATADELLGRVRDRIVGNAGTGQIVESLFLKAAIDVASNLPEDGTIVSDAAIERAIRALEKKVMDKIATAVATETASRDAAIEAAMIADTGIIKSGARILFQQSNAPTGWTKDTAHNDKALRVVSGSVGSGGSVGFISLLNSGTVRGTVRSRVNGGISNHTLSSAQIPSHKHYIFSQHVGYQPAGDSGDLITRNYAGRHIMGKTSNPLEPTVGRTSHVGNNQGHNHEHNISVSSAFSSTTNLDITYVDVIIATKD